MDYCDKYTAHAETVLLHNDAHNENIFVNQIGDLLCIIDFGDALWGDPHLDFINFIHAYPKHWELIIDSYEKSSGKILDKKRILALAIIRFSKQLIKMWNEQNDAAHVQSKFADYADLIAMI